MFKLFKKKKSNQIEDEKEQIVAEDFTDISMISKYFKNETGVTFEKQTTILKNKVTTFCRQRNIYSFSDLLTLIQSKQDLKQELINYLTTNETFFYREFKQIKKLVELVKKSNLKVDILCAPSATGEEPYSIAIALLESGIPPNKFHIVGIDINSDALCKAYRARYRERNVINLSQDIINRYFTN
jgi:chemotaxis protein methyltransferase CheR